MNLLNARFHLYERAIYHPTKCAAGAMLGTALQLMGWRKRDGRASPPLHQELQYLGDDVFMSDLRASLRLIIPILKTWSATKVITEEDVAVFSGFGSVHSSLPVRVVQQRTGSKVETALLDLEASARLLARIGARRFPRPVFRALPSSRDPILGVGAESLADQLSAPDERFAAERLIEQRAKLPLGSIFIHCPRRSTAEKIAKVLLVRPKEDGHDEFCKLRHIASLDAEVFEKHQAAIKAVEDMYSSMWRLVVYVEPRYMNRHKAERSPQFLANCNHW